MSSPSARVLARFKRWLAHPLTLGLDLDDPQLSLLRRQVIIEKRFLYRVYQEWYTAISKAIPAGPGQVLELGSGGGFLADVIPDVITSDVLNIAGVDLVIDGRHLPFAEKTIRAVVMTDVLHHLPEPRQFFAEAARCVRPHGVITMIEPWVTPWSRLIYAHLHHEPFEPAAAAWEFPSAGPLSGANGAQAWILFVRDREQFEQEFPEWQIAAIVPDMPFTYLLSGGLTTRASLPEAAFPLVRKAEHFLHPWTHKLAMFAQITLIRTEQ